ncbi:MAG: hypothetical protein KC897_13320, partial [Candidatus Omnitrophica bacterium]|nr:hypothetical protein [Candidatus Omnitrophota bacterium]
LFCVPAIPLSLPKHPSALHLENKLLRGSVLFIFWRYGRSMQFASDLDYTKWCADLLNCMFNFTLLFRHFAFLPSFHRLIFRYSHARH